MSQLRKRGLQPLAPRECPQCGMERSFVVTREKTECSHCGYVHERHAAPLDETPKAKARAQAAPPDPSQYPISYRITHPGGVESYVEAAYTTAMDCARHQDWDGLIHNLRRCLDYRHDFTDAHLWLGRILPDADARRDHLTTLLAHDPNNAEGIRELMILNGEINPDAEFDEYSMPQQRAVGGAVKASGTKLNCVRCGSPNLHADAQSGMLVCESCGHSQAKPQAGISGMQSLSQAIIKRRSQAVQWVVDTHWIQCSACGSTRTAAAEQLKHQCPFCGSSQVLQTDAVGALQQPDALIPFRITRQQALEIVKERLEGRMERIKGWFVNNNVERLEIEGVFLPFWMFDAVVEVKRTTRDLRGESSRVGGAGMNLAQSAYMQETLPEMANNVSVPAVKSPPAKQLHKIDNYHLKHAVRYKPDLIAQHSAELYQIDFDQAAMTAHEIIGRQMRQRYKVTTGSSEVEVNVFSMVKQMSFSMLLKPVWSVSVIEKDGDLRSALVNGQTGRLHIGRAHKPGQLN